MLRQNRLSVDCSLRSRILVTTGLSFNRTELEAKFKQVSAVLGSERELVPCIRGAARKRWTCQMHMFEADATRDWGYKANLLLLHVLPTSPGAGHFAVRSAQES